MHAGPAADAPSSPWNTQASFLSWEIPVDQPVSNSRLPVLPMPSVVPPTAIAFGSIDGSRTPEPSPAEKYMPTPSAAARTR